MPDWLIVYLGQIQGGIVKNLAAELRAGGLGAVLLASSLGALHALTPGHGKAALAAYFLGRNAQIGAGLRVALTASLLHVLSGFAAFLVLKFIVGQVPSLLGRGSPGFTAFGYSLIILSGIIMLLQSLRTQRPHNHAAHTLTAGIGLLPCPLTISVLGFAWIQGSAWMVGLVLVALALGIAFTIGIVALCAILARWSMGAAIGPRLSALDRGGRIVQGVCGILIIAIGIYTMSKLRF
jgi:nickel/cobalt exporter